VEACLPLIEACGHELTVNVPREPVRLEGDPTRLTQIVSNLLNNAAKYTDKKGHIWLFVEPRGSEAVVTVKDTGVGIAAAMLPRVFDMFTQVDRTLKRSLGGLGIGLSLARTLVELHGGRIGALSGGPGHGSEFTLRLPLRARDVAAAAPGSRPGGPPPALSPVRVLVVDDNRDAADSLGILLQFLGAESQVVYDGPAALQAVPAFRPAAVLLDIGMPGMDGHEVARRIRQEPAGRDAVLIAVTGWGQEEDQRRSSEAGFDHHLVKPVDADSLQALLVSLDSGRRRAGIS
jgi:CheY-like chemotaxis protein